MTEKKSLAARVCAGEADPPKNVQQAITEVEEMVERRGLLLEGELARGEREKDDHDFEMAAAQHYAYQFQEVGGEVIEIRKNGARGKVQLIHRPEMSAKRDARSLAPGKV